MASHKEIMDTINALKRSAIDPAATTLEHAFSPDPMFEWVFPDPPTRPAALRTLNRVPLEYGLRYGRVMASHEARAVCVWIPPPGITVPRVIRSGFLGVPFRVGFGPFAEFAGANDTMEKIKKRRVSEAHWYLMVMGVDPELQGRGLGSALVQEGLARVDESGHPCYTETSERRNLPFYERHGFVILEEATLGKGGPLAWAMRREPKREAAAREGGAERGARAR